MISTNTHPLYDKYAPIWRKCRLAQHGQHAIHRAGESILPKTSGMKNKSFGQDIYDAYKARARFYPLVESYVDTIIGLATQKELTCETTHDDSRVTKNKLSVEMLTQQVIENVAVVGGHVLVNDFTEGKPYITQYRIEALVDWALDDDDEYIWAKFSEEYDASEDVRTRDIRMRYREYQLMDGKWYVYTTDEGGAELSEPVELSLPVDENGRQYCPITRIGSRTNQPFPDRVPSLPIVDACIAAYQLSADYRQSLHGQSQPTAWATGINQTDLDGILQAGSGVGSIWAIADSDAEVGYLEMEANGLVEASAEIERELNHAKEQALRVTTKDTNSANETATGVMERTSSQRASVWTMFHAISEGIHRALMILDRSEGHTKEVIFEIKAEFTQKDASYNMLNALNSAVNSGNLPQSAIFQWMRDGKMTQKSDEELAEEIQTQTPSVNLL
jgi:hypothetical protein